MRIRAALALARAGLFEGRRSACYLILTLAITTGAWLALSALAAPFVGGGTSAGSGVTIRNGSQSNAPLPLSYARRIEAIPGAHNVTWATLQLVSCKPGITVTLNAYGGPGTTTEVASQQRPIAPAAMQRWNADPLGILISDKDAADCGWRVGQGVEPQDVFGRKHVPLHVSSVFHDSSDVAFAHFDYINRIDPLFGKDQVFWYLANTGNARGDEVLAAHIEAAFAHDFPTVSATTNATEQNAWARFGKVQQLLAFVMAAILLCAASILISVLAHAAAQRRSKFALLQVLGFRRGVLFSSMVLELLMVTILGGLFGTGLGKLASHLLAPTTLGVISGGFSIPVWAYVWMPLWLFLLVAAALIGPAIVVARVRPVDYRAI